MELEKECDFPVFSRELLIIKVRTSIFNKKLRDKLLKGRNLDVPNVVEQLQQNT